MYVHLKRNFVYKFFHEKSLILNDYTDARLHAVKRSLRRARELAIIKIAFLFLLIDKIEKYYLKLN